MKKILFCASEAVPYIKTGGLADVAGALPASLKEQNVDARVVLPYYKKIKEKNIATYVGYSYVNIANRLEYCGFFHSIHDGVDYYFIDSERYFNRDGLYGYGDDGERFAFFDFAILEMLKVVNFYPDVLHLNDWQTGLVPYILKKNYHFHEEYREIKTVFSIHNIQYQGNFPNELMNILFMPYSNALEFDNNINFMKTAIVESDIINTVSPTYKEEVLTDSFGYNLNNILGTRFFDFYGILNGIDTVKFDPLTDPNIAVNYDYFSNEKKALNKKALLEDFGLSSTEDVPLFGLVSRLVDQKGLDLLEPIMGDVLEYSNAKFIFMGSGDKKYEDFFRSLESKYKDRFKCYIGYNESVAQKIYAGADIFLMPSKFEPCGLGQLISMRYGTLPLVRETGGLKDTVQPYNKYAGTGWGFSFSNYSSIELKDVMFLAMTTYNDKAAWHQMIKDAMNKDFSWDVSAKEYIKLYDKALEK